MAGLRRACAALAAVAAATTATFVAPGGVAHATAGVDLQTTIDPPADSSYAGDDVSFTVHVANIGDTDSDVYTVSLNATSAVIVGADTFNGSCTTTSCSSDFGVAAGAVDDIVVTVHVGSDPTFALDASADTTTDVDTSNNHASSSVVVATPAAATITSHVVWPDKLVTVLTDSSTHAPIAGETMTAGCAPAGSTDPLTALQPYSFDTTTDSTGEQDFYIGDLAATSYDCEVDHAATREVAAAQTLQHIDPRATRVAVTYNATTVRYGTSVHVGVTVSYADTGAPIDAAGTARLLSRAVGATTWQQLATFTVDYSGSATYDFAPRAITDYEVVYDGAGIGHGPSTSSVAQVLVRQGITAVLDPAIVPPGWSATLATVVAPTQPGASVSLQRKTSTGWTTVTSKSLSTTSKQSFAIKQSTVGTYTYRVNRPASSTLLGTATGSLTLTVTLKGKGDWRAHKFLGVYNRHPYSWNPCTVIHYRVNLHNAPREALVDVNETLRRIHLVSGLRFSYDGTTSVVPTSNASNQSEPLVIAWSSKAPGGYPWGLIAGYGGMSRLIYRHGHEVALRGFALLNSNMHFTAGFGRGSTEGQLLMHELGHAVGMDHPDHTGYSNSYEIMHGQMLSMAATVYGAGDIWALQHLGTSQGCF